MVVVVVWRQMRICKCACVSVCVASVMQSKISLSHFVGNLGLGVVR